MSATARFRCWQITVLLLLVGQSIALITAALGHLSARSIDIGIALFELPIIALIALLFTTPPGAIRLPPRKSRRIVIGGTLLLQFVVLGCTPMRDWPYQSKTALAVVCVVILAVIALQRSGRSAWWIVPLAWNPILLAFSFPHG